jgi:hypothetical protein
MAQPSKTQILRLYRDYMRSAQSFVSAPASGASGVTANERRAPQGCARGRRVQDESVAWPQRHGPGWLALRVLRLLR